MVTQKARKVPNWKCPGPNGVLGYWLKNFPALHEGIPTQIDDVINNGTDISNMDGSREDNTLPKRSRTK